MDLPDAPAHWGDMRQHMFWGALYHWFVLTGFWDYRNFRPHRALTVGQEFLLYCKRLILLPLHRYERMVATWRIQHGGAPYHLVLLQLEHDASFQMHSPFAHHDRISGRWSLTALPRGRRHITIWSSRPTRWRMAASPSPAKSAGWPRFTAWQSRVHFVQGGKLAQLLNHARTAVTVNSTAAQQVLWRGLPLKVFGAAVYAKPEFVSTQTLPDFFAHPNAPRQPRLPRLSPLPPGNLAGARRFLLDARTARTAAPSRRHDAATRRSL